MAEEKSKRTLELLLVVASKWDVLKRASADASRKSAKKVGEMDVYEYMKAGAGGVVFYKEVFDEKGKLKNFYLSSSRRLVYGAESIKLIKDLNVLPPWEFVYIGNKREIEDA